MDRFLSNATSSFRSASSPLHPSSSFYTSSHFPPPASGMSFGSQPALRSSSPTLHPTSSFTSSYFPSAPGPSSGPLPPLGTDTVPFPFLLPSMPSSSTGAASLPPMFSAWRRDGFPFTALRVADVVGPYDNLGCHLRLQQRLRAGWRVGTRLANVPDADTHRISVAYAPDVAAAVLAVLRAGPAVHGEALNIACTEACTYPEYIGHVARALGCVPRIDPRVSADMVSVCIGPIDTTKARRLLQWDPTPLADAVEATVRWYLDPANVAYTLRFDADSSSGSDPG